MNGSRASGGSSREAAGLEQRSLCLCVCSSSTWPPRAGLAWESDSDLKGPSALILTAETEESGCLLWKEVEARAAASQWALRWGEQ